MSWKTLRQITTGGLGEQTQISGNYAIVSDPFFNVAQDNDGQIRIYERKSNGDWDQVYVRTGNSGAQAFFGSSVAISGNYAIAGEHAFANDSGRARFYERKNGTWEETQIIASPQGVGQQFSFGRGVAVSGNLAAVGAPGAFAGGAGPGRVYWYRRNPGNGNWEQVGDPVDGNYNLNAGGQFGYNIKMSGNYAIIGEFGFGGAAVITGNGRAYWYEYCDGSWSQVFFDGGKVPQMTFGWGVGINGNYAIVGAPGVTGQGAANNPGFAYIYERKSNGDWELVESLRGENNTDLFGEWVSVSGSYAMVGAPRVNGGSGRIYFYQRKRDGKWERIQTDTGIAGGNQLLGYSLSIDGNYAIGGGYLNGIVRFYQKGV